LKPSVTLSRPCDSLWLKAKWLSRIIYG
jgi:hypothetical protein